MGSYGETMENNLGLNTKSLMLFLLGIMMVLIILSGIITSRPKSIKSKADEPAGSVLLSINPAAINLKIGQREKFDLYINSNNQPVDGFTIKLKFDKEKLRVTLPIINPPFEGVINWVDRTNGIYLGGVLPPGVASPLTSRSFAVASFYVEGLSQTDATEENISFEKDYKNFQVVSNGSSYIINTLINAKVCVDSTASSCPAFVCSQPEAPTIQYPLNNKKTTEPNLEVYFTAPHQGCFPKEYQASLYRGTEMVCRTNWKSITTSETRLINLSEFKSAASGFSQDCPELSLGRYTVKVQLKSGTNVSELAQSNFTYTNEQFNSDHPGNRFIGTFGSTDVVIPSGYSQVNRRCIGPPAFRDKYMKTGNDDFFFGDSVCVSWGYCNDKTYWPEKYQSFNDCVAYYYRKLREIAINSGRIKSINIDDVKFISVDPKRMEYSEIVKAATGMTNAPFGVTYYGEDECPSFAKDVKFVYLYARTKNDYLGKFQKFKDCFSNAKMIVGLYARSMKVYFGGNESDQEEIINSCNYAKDAKSLLDSGIAAGIEIYDGSPSDSTKDSYYELNKKIATLTSEILATGNSSYCN